MEPDLLSKGLDRLQHQQNAADKNLMEGHAQKMKKGFFSKWQKIYMVLTRTELRIYKGSSIRRSRDIDDKKIELPKGAKYRQLPLKDMIVKDSPTKMKKQEFVFDIFAANAKRFVIAAPTDFLKKQWMIKITAAANESKGPTDSERKRTQAEVDKELLRLAEHIRGEQAQQRARAVPIHMAQGLRQPNAPNDLISTEERKASLYRTASAFPVSSFRLDKKPPPPPVPGPRAHTVNQSTSSSSSSGSSSFSSTPPQAIPGAGRPSSPVPCFSGVVDSRRGSFDDGQSRLSSSYGANTIVASGAGAGGQPRSPPPAPARRVGLPAGGRGDQQQKQSAQLARHSVSMKSVRELGALPPPPIPPLPSRPTAPPNAPPARPPPRIPPPQLTQRKAVMAAAAAAAAAAPPTPSAPVPTPAAGQAPDAARPALPPRPKNSIGGRKEVSEPAAVGGASAAASASTAKVCSPAVPPRVPKVPLGAAATGPEPSPRGRFRTAPESEAPRPAGGVMALTSSVPDASSSASAGAKLFSPRIRISSSQDDDAPLFERPHAREAAEDTPLTRREPLSSPTVRPLAAFTPAQPLVPLVPPRAERPSPPTPGPRPQPPAVGGSAGGGSGGGGGGGSRIEKASVVHRQPKHFLPAPVPRPNQLDDGEITEGATEAAVPSRPPRPTRSKTGLA